MRYRFCGYCHCLDVCSFLFLLKGKRTLDESSLFHNRKKSGVVSFQNFSIDPDSRLLLSFCTNCSEKNEVEQTKSPFINQNLVAYISPRW